MNEFDIEEWFEEKVKECKKKIDVNLGKYFEEKIISMIKEMEREDNQNSDWLLDCSCSRGQKLICEKAIRRKTFHEMIRKGYLTEKIWESRDWSS